MDEPTKTAIAEKIIARELEISNESDSTNVDNIISRSGCISHKSRQKAFLQRVLPHWFMKPFNTRAGDSLETGLHNE